MVSIWRKKQQNKKLLMQLSESDVDIMIGQHDHGAQFEEWTNTADEHATPKKANNSFQVNGSQAEIRTFEKNC